MVTVTSGTNGYMASEACPIDLQPVSQGQELLQWFHSLCLDCDQLTKRTNLSMVRALKLGIESSLVLLYSQIPFFPLQLCRVELKQAGAVIMHKIPCLFTRAGSRKEASSALPYPQVYYQHHIERIGFILLSVLRRHVLSFSFLLPLLHHGFPLLF